MIAKQYDNASTADFVRWTHADPLTGSKQEVTKTGAPAGGIKAREEYEPLGQSVRPTAPIVLDPPGGSPSPITNNSSFPEWQCGLPLELIPTHCALKILADGNKFFGNWGADKKQGNVAKIYDSPLSSDYNSSNEMMGFALTSSSKKDKQKKKKGGSGDDTFYGAANGESFVTVRDDSIPGFVDASDNEKVWGNGLSARRLFRTEVLALKESVQQALNNTTLCKTYIEDLIKKVQVNRNNNENFSTDILALFDEVFKVRGRNPDEGGIWGFTSYSWYALASNRWGSGFAEIAIPFSNSIPSGLKSKLNIEEQALAQYRSVVDFVTSPKKGGITTIHELIHVAIRKTYAGDDTEFADAAADLAGETRPTKFHSNYWGERLNQACGFTSHITHQFTNYNLYK